MKQSVVKMLCHNGNVCDLAIDRAGTEMVTTGIDGQIKVWDVRTYKEINTYNLAKTAKSIDISQRGVLSVSSGSLVQVWKRNFSEKFGEPYMSHHVPNGSAIRNMRFCPYEDLLGIGHDYGFSQIIIPGAGEPNIDTFEGNPFETKKQRRETTVVRLLEKIPPDMIALDPTRVGTIMAQNEKKVAEKAKEQPEVVGGKRKNKSRGKNKPTKKIAKKQLNIIEKKRAEFDAKRIEREDKAKAQRQQEKVPPPAPVNALARFSKVSSS